MVKVELIFIDEKQQIFHKPYSLPQGSSVSQLLSLANISLKKDYAVGIYSKKVSLDKVLQDGDRVEIYRPLVEDPKDKRRKRAKAKRVIL